MLFSRVLQRSSCLATRSRRCSSTIITLTRRRLPSATSTSVVFVGGKNNNIDSKHNIFPRPSSSTSSFQIRSHMNHGGGGGGGNNVNNQIAIPVGPRTPYVPLGLEVTKHTGNILRLLESSHQYTGGSGSGGNFLSSTVWHMKRGQYWIMNNDNNDSSSSSSWKAYTPDDDGIPATKSTTTKTTIPKLEYMNFADECTVLIKLIGNDNLTRYLSLVKLMEDDSIPQKESMGGPPFLANDGWMIVREVVCCNNSSSDDNGDKTTKIEIWNDLLQTIQTYLDIEHGGGIEDKDRATKLFHPQAKLISVGISSDSHNEWSAPVGCLVDVSLETYLDGVELQTPHTSKSKNYDSIVSIDVADNNSTAAAVTLTVGNGTCTTLFRDHLLLGRSNTSNNNKSGGGWQILSKTFSPQPWPTQAQ